MKKRELHVLSLSYAQELFVEKDKALGDTLIRSVAYSKQIATYTIIVHTLTNRGFASMHPSPNFWIIPTNGLNRPHSLLKMYSIANKICSEQTINLIQSQEPIFTGFLSLLLSRKYNIPLNILLYGGNVYDPYWVKQRLLNRTFSGLGKYILNHADSIQVEGSLIKQSLINHAIDAKKIFIKPMVPHNLELFSEAEGNELRKRLFQDNFDNLILFVGRLIKEKNLVAFFTAFKIILQAHPRTLLVIAGDGKEKKNLYKQALNLSINKNILWVPHIAHEELPKYYKAADIFILFSVSEGFPRVLMEAAAAGTPIVSSKISGSTDAIDNGKTGFIININDIHACVEKVILLLDNPSLRKKMGAAAPAFIKKIGTFQDNINKQIEIWQKISK